MVPPRRRTPNIRRAKPERRYYIRREDGERRQAPITTPFNPIADVYRIIETMWTLGTGRGWTAELENEDEPDGLVVLRDEHGHPKIYMPRDVYEALLKT